MLEPPKIYWDACIFLSYINGDPDRLPDIDAYLDRSGKEIQIVTSALSIAEVAFAKVEQDGKALDPAVEAKIDALWFAPDSPIRLIELYPLLSIEARTLMRDALASGIKVLKPADAIHMATARHIGVGEIHNYDDGTWRKYEKILGIKIVEPRFRNLQYTLDNILRPDLAHLPRGAWDDIDAWPAHSSSTLGKTCPLALT